MRGRVASCCALGYASCVALSDTLSSTSPKAPPCTFSGTWRASEDHGPLCGGLLSQVVGWDARTVVHLV